MKNDSGKSFCISTSKYWHVFLAGDGNSPFGLWWPREQKEWLETWRSLAGNKHALVSFTFHLMRMIHFGIAQGRTTRQMRAMHTCISTTRRTGSRENGELSSLGSWMRGQLEGSNEVIKFMFVDCKHGQAVNLFVNCELRDILQLAIR